MHISTQGSPLRRRTVAFVCPSARPPLSACSDEEILFVPRLSRSKHPPDVDDVSPDDVSGGCTSVPRYKSVPSRYNSPLDDYISNTMAASPPDPPVASFALFLPSDNNLYLSGDDEPNESLAHAAWNDPSDSSASPSIQGPFTYACPIDPSESDSSDRQWTRFKRHRPHTKRLHRKKKPDRPTLDLARINSQIREFIHSDNHTLVLPPMDRASRKIIHLLALAYNLKSKSSGSGARRRPSLIRTPRTTYSPNEQMIASILKRKHSHNPSPHKIKPWIRDGEIVGNGAPEIAQNNKGRRMLENLGWKSGMVLGTCNAQSGNLHPIQAIFKNNKFGLG